MSQYQLQSPPAAKALINQRDMDYFCGTGYYTLQAHPDVIDAACDATRRYGLGSATSRAGFGNNPVLLDVEAKGAKFFEQERALCYVSGYLGNAILQQGLAPDYDLIFVDSESHYSILDGIAMSGKAHLSFVHRSTQSYDAVKSLADK